jgi:hypothetical protein
MAEKCPLFSGEHAIDSIPEFCLKHCYEQWDKAIMHQVGDYDFYDPSKDDCNHEMYPVAFSHEAVDRPDGSSLRLYSIVDMCEGCQAELGETTRQFECPFNE